MNIVQKISKQDLRRQLDSRQMENRRITFSDVVKLNHDEVRALAPLLELESGDPAAFAEKLIQRFDVELVCVTRAAEGALLIGREQRLELAGIPVEVADAVGAGDAFTAALIFGRLQGWPISVIGPFANRLGGLVAGRPGAMPELGEELAELLRQAEAGFAGQEPNR